MRRREFITLVGSAVTLISGLAEAAATTAFDWQTVAPNEADFADLEARFDRLVASKRVWNLHGVVVARGGRIVLERYFEGEQNSWGKLLGRTQLAPDTLAQSLFGDQKRRWAPLRRCAGRGEGAATGHIALRSVFRIQRFGGSRSEAQGANNCGRTHHDARPSVG